MLLNADAVNRINFAAADNNAGKAISDAINYGQTEVGSLAAAGSAQGDAAAIVDTTTIVSGADGTKGVILPADTPVGSLYEVYNTHASNGLKIYPPSGGDINDGTGDAAITTEGKTLARFRNLDGVTWAAQFTANT